MPYNFQVVELWSLWKTLGAWALEHVNIEGSPKEIEDLIWRMYYLESMNNEFIREKQNQEDD